jgi:hypothetical protein
MKTAIPQFVIVVSLACLAPLQNAQAVSPASDGCYRQFTTAEGCDALNSLTSGAGNTGVGWRSLFLNTSGSFNTALGAGALILNNGDSNTATGAAALLLNTSGAGNTANGTNALVHNDDGVNNTAVGSFALFSNTSGDFNNAFGNNALVNHMTGNSNNAFGDLALFNETSGNFNTALGAGAGSLLQSGSGNVYIGSGVGGMANEDSHTYIRNIKDTSVSGGGTDTVTVNLSTGLLGHLSSSRRHKEHIKSMANSSEVLYRLKPVTYRYKKEIDATQALDYGLVAEDVAEIDPNLAARNRDGQIETVRYNAINAMLLNEFLKEHRKVEQMHKQIEALTTALQKVAAQLEVSKPAPQTGLNQ